MVSYSKSHRKIAFFLLISFLPSIFPYSNLLASNTGPVAPEASGFEPVDATDMVNLASGDLSYVLPILNVPSPEGGYPLALSYHAGIALDQEASWVGLGWNLNPGAVNRGVNGYPDDWMDGSFKEYFYDSGDQQTFYNASIGYTSFATGVSVGLSVSYSDEKGFGGSVSYGNEIFGLSAGTDGFSVSSGFNIGNSGLGIGGSIGTNGYGIGISYGYDRGVDKNGKNFYNNSFNLGINSSWSGDISVNASYSNGEKGKKNSIGISFSSSGVNISGSINGAGTAANFAFNKSIKQSDYTIRRSGFFIPVIIPISPTGDAITGSFGVQKIKYYLDKLENYEVNGPLYYKQAQEQGEWECLYRIDQTYPAVYYTHPVDANHVHQNVYVYEVYLKKNNNSLMDVYEVDLYDNSTSLKLDNNNAVFPNYDNYSVSAQGLSGSMKPILYKNGALMSLNKEIEEENNNDYQLTYKIPQEASAAGIYRFNSRPEFQFENEYSSSLYITPAKFNSTNPLTEMYGYLNTLETSPNEFGRKKGARYIDTYTNAQLSNPTVYNTGFLKADANIDYTNTSQFDPDGIGAFKITTADGKTYHYSLPVYNYEIVTRKFGIVASRPNEDDAFFEKRQLKKYATHWLLTAVTGPDYIDINDNHIADENDYGYWVTMEYGKWSDGYIWYAPHGKEYEDDRQNPEIKSYTWGRKEIYYLDKVKTRTHTALFVKEERNDSRGKQLIYKHRLNKYTATRSFSFSGQSLLRLKEIILLKNEDAVSIGKVNISNLSSIPNNNYSHTINWFDPIDDGGGTKTVSYSLQNNVLDKGDMVNWIAIKEKSLKIVDFSGYSYDLANDAPYTFGGVNGRLTLKYVTFRGKGGVQMMPSYKFDYHLGAYNIGFKDEWGYNKYYPQAWNLRKITMPTGGTISIEYEPDTFISAISHSVNFDGTQPDAGNTITIESADLDFSAYNVNIGDRLPYQYYKYVSCNTVTHDTYGDPLPKPQIRYSFYSYYGLVTVQQFLTSKKLKLKLDNAPNYYENSYSSFNSCAELASGNINLNNVHIPLDFYSSGSRVRSISTSDDINTFKTVYEYNKPGTDETSGIVSYIPFIAEVTGEVPYGFELPAPVPMYGYVKTTAYGANNVSLGSIAYEFKTLHPKTPNKIKFGDALEVNMALEDAFMDQENNKFVRINSFEIKDNLNSLGQLLSTTTYNNSGQLISKIINNYVPRDNINQGVSQQSFQVYKDVNYENNVGNPDRWQINSSSRVTFPSVLASTTVIEGGFVSNTSFDNHDVVSGELIETTTVSSDGTLFRTESVPAYTKYPVMGSKADNPTYKNMLTQTALNRSLVLQNNEWITTGVGITTWKPEIYSYTLSNGIIVNYVDVWRKHKTYTWNGQSTPDGLFVNYSGQDDTFNWDTNATGQPPEWMLLSEITKYDKYSATLETTDINLNKVATKMGDNDSKIIAVANASFNEMHYSGAEYIYAGNFDNGISGIGQSNEKAHTGKYSAKISTQQGFRTYINSHRAGRYKISVWASKDNYANARVFDGISLKPFNGEKVIAGDWVLLNHYIDWDTASKTVYLNAASGYVYFDDFRVHPVQASMTSYVYNQWEELIAILSNNNLARLYEYDEIGRLIDGYAEVVDSGSFIGGFKKVSENIYQYSSPVATTIQPLFAHVTYGNSTTSSQEFVGTATGGSGSYSFKWYKGIGSSSTDFETGYTSTQPNFTLMVSGCNTQYVKLVVTDNNLSHLGESVRIVRNNNLCDGSGGSNPPQN